MSQIRSRANYSLAILGMAFVFCWAGQFLNIRADTNRLEKAVRAGKKIHEVAPHAAKPGDRPNDYGSPGREKHGKPPPPGQEKHSMLSFPRQS